MAKYKLFIVISAWIDCGIIASFVQAPMGIDAQILDTSDLEAKRTAFQNIRGQLEEKGVPFDPSSLHSKPSRELEIAGKPNFALN